MKKIRSYVLLISLLTVCTGLFPFSFPGSSFLMDKVRDGYHGVRKVFLGDNFHTVVEGELYRCRQLSMEKMAEYIEEYGIKTVLNLRRPVEDGHDISGLLQEEEKMVRGMGLEYYNVPLNTTKMTPVEKLEEILAIFQKAEKPMLIHCLAGSDRTGEVSALYKLYKGYTQREALQELIYGYGHLALFFPKKRQLIANLDTRYPEFWQEIHHPNE